MINFTTALPYYYTKIFEADSNLSKSEIKSISKYLQEHLSTNTFDQIQKLTQTPLGTVDKTTKIYPIDVVYALNSLESNKTFLKQSKKSNLTLHQFIFLANSLQHVLYTIRTEKER